MVSLATRTMGVTCLAACAAAGFACRPAVTPNSPARIAVVGANVIDGVGGPPISDAVVLVEGEHIVDVAPRGELSIPIDAQHIDGRNRWVVPGLVDAHVHFFQSGGLYTRPDVIDLRDLRSYEHEQDSIRARMDRTLCRYLESGVTSVVDAGGPTWTFDLREHADATLLAPRVTVAGPLVSPITPPELDTDDPPIIGVDTSEDALALVRGQLAREPDFVKIWFIEPPERDFASFMPIVETVIAESRAAEVPVMVHATRLEAARLAVGAGANVLAHSISDRVVDDVFVAAMGGRGVIYTTTLLVSRRYQEILHDRPRLAEIERRLGDPEVIASWDDVERLPPARRPPRRDPETFGPSTEAMENLRILQDAGVVIAAGSDAGNIGTLHGPSLHRELELMVEAGLEPMQVVLAATRGGALVFGDPLLGTLESGTIADFLVLDANPLESIENTTRIHRVVKGGIALDPQGLCDDLD